MNLKDPVPAYNGVDTVEVHILQNMLDEAGIDAFIMEDDSPVGFWIGGRMPEIHKPQVWIERVDIDRAKPILDEYERLIAERRAADADQDTNVQPIKVTCDECHKEAVYPHAQLRLGADMPLMRCLRRCDARQHPRRAARYDGRGVVLPWWEASGALTRPGLPNRRLTSSASVSPPPARRRRRP